MLRNQATALLRHEHLTTTVPKAKELRPFVERLITVAKRGLAAGEANGRVLNARRLVMQDLQDREVVDQAVRHDRAAVRVAARAATRGCCASASARATAPKSRRSSSSAASSIRRRKPRPTAAAEAKPKAKGVGGRLRAAAERLRGKKDEAEQAAGGAGKKASKPARGVSRKTTTPRKAGGS